MSLLFALTIASVTVKWEALGACPGNPSTVWTDPGFNHAFRQEVVNSQTRYTIDSQVLPWRPASQLSYASYTGNGKDWYHTFVEGNDRVLWINGKEVLRGYDSVSVVSAKPLVLVVWKSNSSELQVNGKTTVRGKDIFASMAKKGLLTIVEQPDATWRVRQGNWSLSFDSRPQTLETSDGRMVVQGSKATYVDGKVVAGLPSIGNGDELQLTPSRRNWVYKRNQGGVAYWLGGKPLNMGRIGLEPIEDLGFERGALMRKDLVAGESESGFKLYRATANDAPQAFSSLDVAEVLDYQEGMHDGAAALVGLQEGGYAIIHSPKPQTISPKVVWESKGMLSSATEYGGLSVSGNGERLGFLVENALGAWVRINEKSYGPYDNVDYLDEVAVVFSPDGKHFAYVAEQKRSDPMTLFIDGKPTSVTFDGLVKYGSPKWDSNSQLRLVVGKDTLTSDGKAYRVTVNLPR